MNDFFISAVIPAAGLSSRMNSGINKNFMLLNKKPVLLYTLTVFDNCPEINEIIIVCKPGERDFVEELLPLLHKPAKVVPGGDTRQQSVHNGLRAADKRCGIAVIHDGARPFVTEDMIKNTIRKAVECGASTVSVRAKETHAMAYDGKIDKLLDRDLLYTLQTPQTFQYSLILQAHEAAAAGGYIGTDDTSLVKRIGCDAVLAEGAYENIKITTADDLILAEMILNRKQ